jgi:hypothetical protein
VSPRRGAFAEDGVVEPEEPEDRARDLARRALIVLALAALAGLAWWATSALGSA